MNPTVSEIRQGVGQCGDSAAPDAQILSYSMDQKAMSVNCHIGWIRAGKAVCFYRGKYVMLVAGMKKLKEKERQRLLKNGWKDMARRLRNAEVQGGCSGWMEG
jgi:hypothetical protein